MLYHFHEFKNAVLWPTHLASEAAQLMLSPFNQNDTAPSYGKFLHASSEMLERGTRIYIKPEFGIPNVERDGHVLFVTESHLMEKSFCRLTKFERHSPDPSVRASMDNDPIVLIVAPLSGHFATLLRDTARAMIPHHQTYITDWGDAKFVPLTQGEFTLESYIDYLLDMIRTLHALHQGRRVHIIAVCQPSVPVLAATSLLAAYDEPCQPYSMTLMGGPIDTRINPGVVNEYVKSHSIEWFERHIITNVPMYYKGAGRKVCPGFVLLGGFMHMNADKHAAASANHFQHLVRGDKESAHHHRSFYDEYLAVLDVPGPYFIDSLHHAFKEHTLPLGKMTWKGYKIDPREIRKTALFTVEGELDDISCPGQTYAAHDICKNIPMSKRRAHIQKNVGHYGIFNGRRWRGVIQPKVAAFMRANGG